MKKWEQSKRERKKTNSKIRKRKEVKNQGRLYAIQSLQHFGYRSIQPATQKALISNWTIIEASDKTPSQKCWTGGPMDLIDGYTDSPEQQTTKKLYLKIKHTHKLINNLLNTHSLCWLTNYPSIIQAFEEYPFKKEKRP